MSLPTPDQFLSATPTPVTVNTTGTWKRILDHEGIVLKDTATLNDGSHPHSGNDVWVNLPRLFNLDFSSERNVAYFTALPRAGDRQNNAWIGDSLGSAVLLLRPRQSSTPLKLSTEVLTAFGVDLSVPTPLSSFMEVVDDAINNAAHDIEDSGLIRVTLVAPPDWDEGSTPGLNRTVKSGLPTNAIWFVSTDEAYYSTISLSFSISSDVVDKAISWVTSSFDQIKPKKITTSTTTSTKTGSTATHSITATLTRHNRFNLKNPTDDTMISRSASLSFAFDMMNFHINVDLSETSRTLLFTPVGKGTISSVISGAFGSSIGDVEDYLPDGSATDFFKSLFDDVHLWYIKITDEFGQPSGKRLQWGVGLLAVWTPKTNIDICVALTYDSKTSTFFGRLLLSPELANSVDLRRPSWDPRVSPDNVLKDAGVNPSDLHSLNLLDLVGLEGAQPPIPHILKSAVVSFSKSDASGSVFSFSADLVREDTESGGQSSPPDTASQGAPTAFTWEEAAVDVTIRSTKGKPSMYSLDVFSSFKLDPPELPADHAPVLSATFALGLHCEKAETGTTWLLRASAQNLSVVLLQSFFDTSDAKDGAMAVMDKISLKSLNIIYTYSGGTASSFLISGVLVLGALELDLTYQYISALLGPSETTATQVYLDDHKDNEGEKKKLPKNDKYTKGNRSTQSKFFAQLSVTSPHSTIASIAESIKKGAGDQLPSWVGNIEVNPSAATEASPTVELEFSTKSATDPTEKGNTSVLTLWLSIDGFTFTFVQYQGARKKVAPAGTKRIVKRLLRISVDQIPMIKDVPLVGQLPQPFDNLEYVWVEDDSVAADNTKKGITSTELQKITSQMPSNIPQFQVKETNDQKSETNPDLALEAGHHFIVIAKGKVILDHVFHTDKASTTKPTPPPPPPPGTHPLPPPPPPPPTAPSEATPTKGHALVEAGPLSVSALTFQYKNNSLIITVDATLKLGPLTFSVIGFTLELKLSEINQLSHLADVVKRGLISATLHGIEVGVQQGPLSLEGVFIHDVVVDTEKYSGGIVVNFKAWQVLAIGQYTIKSASEGKSGFRAVFVYGKLDGPLIELAFATISGVRLGLGYNYAVRMPLLEELYSFPFISDSASANSGNDPMKVLDSMVGGSKPFVYPKEGACWFCAGMTIKAFDLLTLTAVLMVNIDNGKTNAADKGVIISMLADGILQMEPNAPANASLFYIEIVVGVEMNFVSGYVAANAVLAPASHVYVPEARLVGGASFYTWFGSNPNSGDWVVTIGGFARGYARPTHYPNPDRVGLNFTVGNNIQIIGTMYLAVTPKCAMAGGSLHMSLSVGPVSAYADIMLDAFINFKPFHFRAFISLSVGVECDIDILFIHIHVSIHLGADLILWGPNDFGGHAHVDFWFFGFGIDFGASENNVKDAVHLIEFYEMVKAPGPPSSPPAHDQIGSNVDMTVHKYSIEDGLIPASTPGGDGADHQNFPSTGATKEFQVQAGTLKLRIDCDFALSQAQINNHHPEITDLDLKDKPKSLTLPIPPGQTAPPAVPLIYSKPMHNVVGREAHARLEVSVYKDEGVDDNGNRLKILQNDFKGELVLKSAASALWGQWNPADDPLLQDKPDALQNGADSVMDLVQAVRILPPDPQLYPDIKLNQTRIIDFDATAAMRFTIPGEYPALQDILADIPADKLNEAAFSGAYFEPEKLDNDDTQQIQRWKDFGLLWNHDAAAVVDPAASIAKNVFTAASEPLTVPQLREKMVGRIASVLEWNIPTPAQKGGNDPAFPDAKVPNNPKVNEDGRTDWELEAGQPFRLVTQLDTYYPALPFVVAAAA